MRKKKKNKIFWKIYRILTIILFFLIIGIWIILWMFLDSYEKGTPESTINNVVDMFNNKKFSTIIKYIKIDNELYDDENYLQLLKDKILDNKYESKKAAGLYKDNKPVYTIYDSESNEICKVYLEKSGNKGIFKQSIWNIEKIEDLFGELVNISIVVPENKEVYINDHKINKKYITNNNYIRSEFNNIKEYLTIKENLYELKNIISGTKVYVDNKELVNNENIYLYKYKEDSSILQAENDRLTTIITDYTKYVSNEIGFSNLSSYIYNNSNAYKFLSTISTTNVWNGNHTPCIISNLKFNNMEMYSDKLFKIEVDYKYSYKVGSVNKDFTPHISMYMYKSNDSWYLVELTT